MGKGLEIREFLHGDSYVATLYDAQSTHFVQSDAASGQLQVMITHADYTTKEAYRGLRTLHSRMQALSYVLPPVSFWAVDYQTWCSNHTGQFCPANRTQVKAFLQAYPHYKADVKFDAHGVVASRMVASLELPTDMPGRLIVMRSSREACANLPGGVGAIAFEWGFLW